MGSGCSNEKEAHELPQVHEQEHLASTPWTDWIGLTLDGLALAMEMTPVPGTSGLASLIREINQKLVKLKMARKSCEKLMRIVKLSYRGLATIENLTDESYGKDLKEAVKLADKLLEAWSARGFLDRLFTTSMDDQIKEIYEDIKVVWMAIAAFGERSNKSNAYPTATQIAECVEMEPHFDLDSQKKAFYNLRLIYDFGGYSDPLKKLIEHTAFMHAGEWKNLPYDECIDRIAERIANRISWDTEKAASEKNLFDQLSNEAGEERYEEPKQTKNRITYGGKRAKNNIKSMLRMALKPMRDVGYDKVFPNFAESGPL